MIMIMKPQVGEIWKWFNPGQSDFTLVLIVNINDTKDIVKLLHLYNMAYPHQVGKITSYTKTGFFKDNSSDLYKYWEKLI